MMRRRMRVTARTLTWVGLALLACAPRVALAKFDLDDVVEKARQLAQQPFKDTKELVPQWMLDMSYDQWRDIRFRTDQSLWRKEQLPFEVQFFHLGLYYDRPVMVNEVVGDNVRHFEFSTDQFDYGKNTFAEAVPNDLGYAGLRIHYPIKNGKYKDEVIVFVGASYFRALGRDQNYGLSARGLALNTVASVPEEFPYFREFWLVRPGQHARSVTLYALLDGESVTGAYRFVVTPGNQTSVEVDEHLFLRRPVERLGIAPLTSMFFHGENTTSCFNDFRPEVHDSDGLLLQDGSGEWIWRPLNNPRALQLSAFQMHDPRGFGLVQRDRDFDHYQDLEARSELRPSTWIVPKGSWGDGHVELVELPTDTDIHDNIVSLWRPAAPPQGGEELAFAYTIFWYGDDSSRPPGGRAVATRSDHGVKEKSDVHRFVVDFEGAKLQSLSGERSPEASVTIASGPESAEMLEQQLVKSPATGSWRLTFQVRPKGNQPVEMRAFLHRGEDALTETWSYVLLP